MGKYAFVPVKHARELWSAGVWDAVGRVEDDEAWWEAADPTLARALKVAWGRGVRADGTRVRIVEPWVAHAILPWCRGDVTALIGWIARVAPEELTMTYRAYAGRSKKERR